MTKHEANNERTICPIMDHPFPACYCLRCESIYIAKVLSWCGGNYESCEIYLKNLRDSGLRPEGGK